MVANRRANEETKTVHDASSAIELLKEDHREVQGFFEQFERIEDDAEKEALALKICLALQVHALIEEEIFYPEARNAISKPELIDEAIVEHAAAKQLIAEIEAMEIGDTMRDAKVKVFGEQIAHHVEEEEGELFPAVEAAGMDVNALGQRMSARKAELLKQLAEEGEIRSYLICDQRTKGVERSGTGAGNRFCHTGEPFADSRAPTQRRGVSLVGLADVSLTGRLTCVISPRRYDVRN